MAAVVDEQHQAGAAVEALEFYDLSEGVEELRGLEELLEGADYFGVVLGGVAAQGDGGAVAEDFVADGVDITAGNAVGIQRFEFCFDK